MQRTILPIAYLKDNDPVEIRAAFRNGCGGVIVKGAIPVNVAAEIARMADNDEWRERFRSHSLSLQVEDKQGAPRLWTQDVPELQETCRWLEQDYAQLKAAKLCPESVPGSHREVLRTWFGEEIIQPWHVDRKLTSDTVALEKHIHIHGKGMLVADPCKALSLTFSGNAANNSPRLEVNGRDDEKRLDGHLHDQDVKIIALQPGECIYFGENCLHKSNPNFIERLKFRATIL